MFLDEQRAAVVRKLDGLSDADAVRTPTVSSLSLLTIVKHLAYCERRWFQLVVAGRDLPGLWPPADPQEELRVDPGDTVESVLALYDEHRCRITGDHGNGDLGRPTRIPVRCRVERALGPVAHDRRDRSACRPRRPDPGDDRRNHWVLTAYLRASASKPSACASRRASPISSATSMRSWPRRNRRTSTTNTIPKGRPSGSNARKCARSSTRRVATSPNWTPPRNASPTRPTASASGAGIRSAPTACARCPRRSVCVGCAARG